MCWTFIIQYGTRVLMAEGMGEQAAEVCTYIRALIRAQYGARVARSVTVQYGGSMKSENARELLSHEDIDGGLIGGASLEPNSLMEIVHAANQD